MTLSAKPLWAVGGVLLTAIGVSAGVTALQPHHPTYGYRRLHQHRIQDSIAAQEAVRRHRLDGFCAADWAMAQTMEDHRTVIRGYGPLMHDEHGSCRMTDSGTVVWSPKSH